MTQKDILTYSKFLKKNHFEHMITEKNIRYGFIDFKDKTQLERILFMELY